MRRRSTIFGVLVIAALALPMGPAGAAPDRTHPSTKAFCTTMNHFLGFMRSAPRPSSLRKPAGRKLMEQLRATAPRPVAADDLTEQHHGGSGLRAGELAQHPGMAAAGVDAEADEPRVEATGLADDADKLFERVGIGRRLAVVVSFSQPFRILGIAPCRLTSSAKPLEHALALPHSLSTVSRFGGAQS